MKLLLICVTLSLLLLTGCGQQSVNVPSALVSFIETLKENGVDGTLIIREPLNENMEYVAEYSIARYTSTRVLSFFKCKDAEKAEATLNEALQNKKLSGQMRNGDFVMAAIFYPPDEEAVEKLRALFLAHSFE
jgi:hypothetical protein